MIIDGKSIAKKIKEDIKKEVSKLKSQEIHPGLAVILVGEDPASKIYVSNKKKACEEVGINSKEYYLPYETTQSELINLIEKLNSDKTVHGILTQLPLPGHIDEFTVSSCISPQKDVDVFNPENLGRLILNKSELIPCTPAGIIELLNYEKILIEGKYCVVVGRSNIVGKPTAHLLTQKNGTVTLCHSKTKNLVDICRNADILICAVGKSKFITADMIKKGSVVIDVGINRTSDGKLCGDVDFENAKHIAEYITPVPGGVGPMTIAMLMENTVTAAKIQSKKIIEKEVLK